jgi:periplasmic divalent cation tolerance protein
MSVLACLTTCPDAATAERIAETLVGEGLAACVNVLPGVTSIYRWQGVVERAGEVLLVIKTTEAGFAALEERLVALHPYELPELIAVPIDHGLPVYLDWVRNQIARP